MCVELVTTLISHVLLTRASDVVKTAQQSCCVRQLPGNMSDAGRELVLGHRV